MAETLDAGGVLSKADGFHWRKVVDTVRSWLAERGISMSRGNIEAVLRKSLRAMAQGREAEGRVGLREAAAFSGRSARPQEFIAAPHGGKDFGVISPETAGKAGMEPGPIRLQQGWHRSSPHDPKGTGFGAVHIWEAHKGELEALGYKSPEAFI